MAGIRRVQLRRDTTEGITARGCGYNCKGRDVRELELTHYRLIKREEKRQCLEKTDGDYGLRRRAQRRRAADKWLAPE